MKTEKITDMYARVEAERNELRAQLKAAIARIDQLEREREERGPFFVRDMARLAGLPDDASMDAIYEALRTALTGADRLEKALQEIATVLAADPPYAKRQIATVLDHALARADQLEKAVAHVLEHGQIGKQSRARLRSAYLAGVPAEPAEEKPNPDCKFVKMGDHYDCATCGGGRGAPADQWCDSCKARAASSVPAEPATEEYGEARFVCSACGSRSDRQRSTFDTPLAASSVSAGAGLTVHLGYDDEEGDRIYFSVGRAAWERAGSPRHLVAAAGQVPANTIEKAREALLAMIKALDRHSAWCGHYKDAPGHSIINSAPKLAREALDALAAVRTPEEQT